MTIEPFKKKPDNKCTGTITTVMKTNNKVTYERVVETFDSTEERMKK